MIDESFRSVNFLFEDPKKKIRAASKPRSGSDNTSPKTDETLVLRQLMKFGLRNGKQAANEPRIILANPEKQSLTRHETISIVSARENER